MVHENKESDTEALAPLGDVVSEGRTSFCLEFRGALTHNFSTRQSHHQREEHFRLTVLSTVATNSDICLTNHLHFCN
jgi:hypothetical protein